MENQPLTDGAIWIKKASGEQQPFDVEKLKRSLLNAGATAEVVAEIAADIESWIFSGVSTRKIYGRAFALLRKRRTIVALRYKLKQAMLELGPTGYPFEQLMGQIFRKQGFRVEVGQVLQGCCVTHEMDVIATGDRVQHLMECKYSHDQGKQVSVQVPLYVRSRVNDIINVRKVLPEYIGFEFVGWVVTNTRFSSDSIDYGTCAGLKMLAWDYPQGNGIKDLIEREKIFPITVLSNLTQKEKQWLVGQGIVSCVQLLENQNVLEQGEFNIQKMRPLLKELQDICS